MKRTAVRDAGIPENRCPTRTGIRGIPIRPSSDASISTSSEPRCGRTTSCELPGWGSNAVSAILEWSADCNNDGIVDYGQILNGEFADINHNGVPDRICECTGDLYADGFVNGADLGALLAYWGPVTGTPASQAADIDRDGVVNGSDLGILLAGWGACAP